MIDQLHSGAYYWIRDHRGGGLSAPWEPARYQAPYMSTSGQCPERFIGCYGDSDPAEIGPQIQAPDNPINATRERPVCPHDMMIGPVPKKCAECERDLNRGLEIYHLTSYGETFCDDCHILLGYGSGDLNCIHWKCPGCMATYMGKLKQQAAGLKW